MNVIPAEAGTQTEARLAWIPASAGTTIYSIPITRGRYSVSSGQ